MGWTNQTVNYPAIWLNRFSPVDGDFPIQVNQISVQFPGPTSAGRSLVGLAINLLVYVDADRNNDPSNAVKIAQLPATVTASDGVTFSNYAVSVLASTPGDLYIGFSDTYNSGGVSPISFPSPLDTTASQVRSWVAGQSANIDPDYDNLGNNDTLGTIDSFGLPGNWVIRASGDTQAGGGGCPTPTAGASATPTSCVVSAWTDRALIPEARGRAAGATMGSNIYVFGGRPASTTYTNTIYRYDINGNTWTLMTETLPDDRTSNMAAGVLTFPEGDRIFIAGGSGPSSAVISRTLAYNPSDGTLTPKADWPAAPTRIPGGWAVANNKFYIFGGYNPAVPEVLADIWEYNPTTNAWTEITADLSLARGYIATETLPDGMIYLAGGFDELAGGHLRLRHLQPRHRCHNGRTRPTAGEEQQPRLQHRR